MSEREGRGFLSRKEFLLTLAGITGAAVLGVLIEGGGTNLVSSPAEPTSTRGVVTGPVRPAGSPTSSKIIVAEKGSLGTSNPNEDLKRRMSGDTKPSLDPVRSPSPSPSSSPSIIFPSKLN